MYIALALTRISPTLPMSVKILTQTLSSLTVPRALPILRGLSLKYHARNLFISLIFFSIIGPTDMTKKHTVFWDMMTCSFVEVCRGLGEIYCIRLQSEQSPACSIISTGTTFTFTVYKEIIRPKSPFYHCHFV
jgi:hypothetical protein